jgi:homoserine kinase
VSRELGLGQWVAVRAPATSANLGPGFDALGLALDWSEVAQCALAPEGVEVRVVGPGAEEVPADEHNLVVRGMRAVLREAGAGDLGVRVRLQLHLPVGRGLGSSAAAVAAGVVAANRLLGEPLGRERLVELATAIEGHPDNVAPAILGGFCAACAAGGGRVWALRLPPPAGVVAVVAVPRRTLSTREARAVLPAAVPFADAVANVQRACLLVAAVATGRLEALAVATEDRLHQPYRAPLVPGLAECLGAARQAGALGAFLSGAGPAVLALAPADGPVARRVAEAMAGPLQEHGGGEVRTVALAGRGARAEPCAPPA